MKNKFLLLTFSIFLYLFIFICIYLIHINFFKVGVIFYSSLIDSVIALIIFFGLYNTINFFKHITNFESSLIILLLFFIGYSFSISLPTVIDRSLSFYFLEKIRQHDGAINKTAMKQMFIDDYMDEYKLVEMRLTEQLKSGTIELKGNCIVLTKRGYLVTTFSDFFRKNFLANKRLILDSYSDQLTDPLKDSKINNEYLCKKE